MQGHLLAIHQFLGPLQATEEDVVRRLRGQVAYHAVRLHQRVLLLRLRRRAALLLLRLVARLLRSHLVVLCTHRAHNLVVQLLGKRLSAGRVTNNQHLRIHPLWLTRIVHIPRARQQRAIHRASRIHSPQPVGAAHSPTGFGIRGAKERLQPFSELLVRDFIASHSACSCWGVASMNTHTFKYPLHPFRDVLIQLSLTSRMSNVRDFLVPSLSDDVLYKSAQSKHPVDHFRLVVADIPEVESQLQHCSMAVSSGRSSALCGLPRFADSLVFNSMITQIFFIF